jgi:hypothetical protein
MVMPDHGLPNLVRIPRWLSLSAMNAIEEADRQNLRPNHREGLGSSSPAAAASLPVLRRASSRCPGPLGVTVAELGERQIPTGVVVVLVEFE